jgi:hypothetical protein
MREVGQVCRMCQRYGRLTENVRIHSSAPDELDQRLKSSTEGSEIDGYDHETGKARRGESQALGAG